MAGIERNKPIGIFDSGIGGLTVLKSVIHLLPGEETIYLGDTARVPYGTKSAGTVTQYALEIGDFLCGMDVKAIVVACNTASAVALPQLEERFSLPVVGMIEPAAARAVEVTRSGRIGVVGTEGTIRSGAYEKRLKNLDSDLEVISRACPLFVPLAEEGWVKNDVARLAARKYLDEIISKDVDTLILGCTHYPLLSETIRETVGERVSLIESGDEAALALKMLLEKMGEPVASAAPSRRYFVTDTPERFLRLGRQFLGENVTEVGHVDLPRVS